MDEQYDSWKRELTAFLQSPPDKPPAGGGALPELLVFQLGGAQDFVAQARTAGDLWSGSCLLSWLMARAIRAVADEAGPEAVLYPRLQGGAALDAPQQGLSALPSRFIAVVPAGRGLPLAEKALAALRAELARIGGTVFKEARDRALWGAQIQRFARATWAVHAWQPGMDWAANYAALEGRLAARRNTHDFDAWPSKGNEWKDSLSGIEEAIAEEDGKPYGAMNLIKRNWWRSGPGEKRFRRYGGYFAILAMKGGWAAAPAGGGAAQGLALYLKRGEAVARFAAGQARQVVERSGGDVLYAGGGEVLALVPAKEAIHCAQQLRAAFRKDAEGDIACGIAVGHCAVSFQMLLAEAYRMRDAARRDYARAAMSITLYKRVGEVIEWGCTWESAALELMETVAKLTEAKRLSGRFTHVLAQLLQPYGLESPIFSGPVIAAEFAHVVSRQGRGQSDALLGMAMQYLCQIPKGKVRDFLNLFMVGAFFNRTRGER